MSFISLVMAEDTTLRTTIYNTCYVKYVLANCYYYLHVWSSVIYQSVLSEQNWTLATDDNHAMVVLFEIGIIGCSPTSTVSTIEMAPIICTCT